MTDAPPLRTRLAGAALVVASAMTLGTALWLASLTGSDTMWRWLLTAGIERYGETEMLVNAPLVTAIVNVGFPAAAAVFLAVAAAQLLFGWRAYRGSGGRRPLAAALLGLVNPVSAPVSLVAAGLLARWPSRLGIGRTDTAND
ncbi:MAG: hypothetical protein ABEJ30_09970 [Halorientalis sp.]